MLIKLRFGFYNANQLKNKNRQKMIMRELINSHIDIAVVSDTRITQNEQIDAQNTWKQLTNGHSVWSSFVCVICMPNIGINLINSHQNGRDLECEITFESDKISTSKLYAVYLPASAGQNASTLASLAQELT